MTPFKPILALIASDVNIDNGVAPLSGNRRRTSANVATREHSERVTSRGIKVISVRVRAHYIVWSDITFLHDLLKTILDI